MVTFMVVSGFSLSDVRKLYIDEFQDFYLQLFYILEKTGRVKDGSYDKIKSRSENDDAQATVKLLRKQMFNNIINKGKK